MVLPTPPFWIRDRQDPRQVARDDRLVVLVGPRRRGLVRFFRFAAAVLCRGRLGLGRRGHWVDRDGLLQGLHQSLENGVRLGGPDADRVLRGAVGQVSAVAVVSRFRRVRGLAAVVSPGVRVGCRTFRVS